MSAPQVARKADFGFVRYASVWEDARLLLKGLGPRARHGRVLSIASAGDNALALLSLAPRLVVAADLSPAQLACVEIRVAAFRHLKDGDLLGFLGVSENGARLDRYQSLRKDLSAGARAWWDAHPDELRDGLIHAGKFERYLRFFGQRLLPLLQPGPWRGALLDSASPAAQAKTFKDRWDHPLWRGFFKVFFSRTVMGLAGRDKAFFDQVEGPVAEAILARTARALSKLPAASNPWLQYITRGNFSARALPPYLEPELRPRIRRHLDRLELYLGPIQAAPGGPFDALNLSDIFEYMDLDETRRTYAGLLEVTRRRGRLAYWNMMLPRRAPEGLKVRSLDAEARRLGAQDRAWFYGAFRLEEKA